MSKHNENVSPYLRKRLRTWAEFLRGQNPKSREAGSGALAGTDSAPPVEPEASEADAEMGKETASAAPSGHGTNDRTVKNTRRLAIEVPRVEGWGTIKLIDMCG